VKHHLLALAAVPHQAHGPFFYEVDVSRWRTSPEEVLRRTKLEPGDTRLQREWKAWVPGQAHVVDPGDWGAA
jgi:hypothetical protein